MIVFKATLFLLGIFQISTAINPKIDPNLVEQLSIRGWANVLVSFHQDSNLLPRITASFPATSNRGQRISSIKSALEQEAELSQARVVSHLSKAFVPFTSLWISNQIYIPKLDATLLHQLLQFEEIIQISLERVANSVNPVGGLESAISLEGGQIRAEWGVEKIQAEAALALLRNVTGGNIPEIRVGVMSTGKSEFETTVQLLWQDFIFWDRCPCHT